MGGNTITCVVMFADVAGSTAMYENMGDVLARERLFKSLDLLISITEQNGGKLVKTIGDEILVYFTDVDEAIIAAREIQLTAEDDDSADMVGVSIRIGMQYGSAILEQNDIFGDTVNVASRVASMATARQILCTKEVAFLVTRPELVNKLRPFDHLRVKGRQEFLDIYMFGWEAEDDITNMANASSFTNPSRQDQVQTLKLTYQGKKETLTHATTSFILGRGQDCEMIVSGDLISRYHSKIEYRRGKFIITDQSTNGTFVKTQEGQEIFLRREELTLFGAGYISLGKTVVTEGDNLVYFMCE